ncbi:MAG: 4Fe-4S binding protein [Gammaproteobacteria bacterium]|nr:4Fe-4S binding protein [Gammaproteobacteria bacterium]
MPEDGARRTVAWVAAPARAKAYRRARARIMDAVAARVTPVARLLATAVVLCTLVPAPALTQQIADDFPFPQSLVEQVLPGATFFEVRDGDPRVIVGYAADTPDEDALVGYAFLTSDVPPEELGYNGPIEVLVGMDREGTLTGVRVTHYVESYIRTRGDFLRTPGYEAQFTGKSISDPFRAKRDVRVVSRATISVSAMSRGIRASARRVYANYLATRPSAESGGSLLTIGMEELEELSWSDMVAGELVPQIHVLENDVTRIVLSFAHIRSDSVGEMLVGRSRFGEVAEQLGERVQEDPLMLVGVDGALALLFYPRTLSLVQGADTIDMDNPDLVMLGEPRSGMVQGQFRNVGVMAVPGSLDVEQAFDIHFDLRPGMGLYTTAYPPPQLTAPAVAEEQGEEQAAEETVAAIEVSGEATPETAEDDPSPAPSEPPENPAGAGDAAEDVSARTGEGDAAEAAPDDPGMAGDTAPAEAVAVGESSSPDDPTAAPVPADAAEAADVAAGDPAPPANPSEAELGENPSAAVQPSAPPDLDFSLAEEQTVLERTLARTSPAEVAWMLGLLALVTVAFFLKRDRLRWVALVATFLYLGWFDGGFLSVSHITAVISVGPAVLLEDIPLLLFVVFTVVTTLLVGRVFCGFLCPFGVLQDFLEKVVPRRFKRELPRALHERLYLVKYVCLAAILLPALAGSRASIFSFFEPFGTVFFLSSSIVLWGIAGGILVASAIVPRFYCRYACPLGAALAVASTVSPFRIRRVEHCDHCKVCEQACPTGAIEGPRIDFRECVRCNICEAKLIEQAGVCRHDIDEVRRRLVQLKVAPGAGIETGPGLGASARIETGA